MSTIRYWNQVKGEKTCKVDSTDIKIASVELGKEVSGKHIDSKVVFYVIWNKVVCHLYNTTQLILVNGNGYANFIEIFLKPYFQSKIDLHMDGIASYNSLALDALGVKQVKRSTVKYKGGSSFPCKLCDFAAKNLSTLKKHDVSYHGINLYASNSLSSLAPLKHSTRNNSISEALLQENLTITSLSNQSAKVTLDDNTRWVALMIQLEQQKHGEFVVGG